MMSDPEQLSAGTKPSLREKDENYHRIVAVLNEKWRVIECNDGIQWILQKASPSEWKSVSYPRNRDSLIQRVRSLCGPCTDAAMARLVALPDWIHQTSHLPIMEVLS